MCQFFVKILAEFGLFDDLLIDVVIIPLFRYYFLFAVFELLEFAFFHLLYHVLEAVPGGDSFALLLLLSWQLSVLEIDGGDGSSSLSSFGGLSLGFHHLAESIQQRN